MIYGYVRISTKKQVITVNRPEWNRLKKIVAAGDTIVFDSVSRMSRNADKEIIIYFN